MRLESLADKVALVTGGAGGIGLAIAQSLAAQGARVAIADIAEDRLQAALAGSGGLSGVALDVTQAEDWRRAVDEVEARLGPISLLVNNAGVGGGKPVGFDDPARWSLVLAVNVFGPFLGCNTLIPKMLERGTPAHIVNVASLAGLYAAPTMSSYNASKHALVGLTDTLRGELAGSNIGVSLVYPAAVKTNFIGNSRALFAQRTGLADAGPTVQGLLDHGMAPDDLALLVVRAILRGDYHVFTHGGWKDRLVSHFAERVAAYGEDEDYAAVQTAAALDSEVAKIRIRPED